jgi:hypothetical protein
LKCFGSNKNNIGGAEKKVTWKVCFLENHQNASK